MVVHPTAVHFVDEDAGIQPLDADIFDHPD